MKLVALHTNLVLLVVQSRQAVSFHISTRSVSLFSLRSLPAKSFPFRATRSLVGEISTTEAVKALERLLEQQQSELLETQRLLDLLESLSGSDDPNPHYLDSTNASSLSAAASLLAGFDYGFVSRSEGAPSELSGGAGVQDGGLALGGPPKNIFSLGTKQFMRNLDAMKGEYRDEADVELTPKQKELQAKLEQLKLNSTEIWERELADGPIQAPWVIKAPYLLVCYMLDVLFERSYVPSRFYLLETVARMPYFSYIGMLHFYETLGFWRRSAAAKRIHFAEEINEYRHLLIMESLGGDQSWWVRVVAQHSAIVYFFVLCILWALSPTLSYRFSELLETHAVNTYGVFLDDNEELLKALPPSLAAVEYYSLGASDPFYAEFQTTASSPGKKIRRPGSQMKSLYDVFTAIRADEGDHVSAMQACLDPETSIQSPSLEKILLVKIVLVAAAPLLLTGGINVMDSLDMVGDASSQVLTDAEGIEALALGASVVIEKLLQNEDEGGILRVGADLVEGGAFMEALRRGALSAVEALAGIFARLL